METFFLNEVKKTFQVKITQPEFPSIRLTKGK